MLDTRLDKRSGIINNNSLNFLPECAKIDHLCYLCLVLLYFNHARLFVDALWSPAGKGLTSWLSFVMPNCDVVTFPLVSWVTRGAGLYRFLIFAIFLTLTHLCRIEFSTAII